MRGYCPQNKPKAMELATQLITTRTKETDSLNKLKTVKNVNHDRPTCKQPSCRIYLPIIEPIIVLILVHAINGGYRLVLPVQGSKLGSLCNNVTTTFAKSHQTHWSI